MTLQESDSAAFEKFLHNFSLPHNKNKRLDYIIERMILQSFLCEMLHLLYFQRDRKREHTMFTIFPIFKHNYALQ